MSKNEIADDTSLALAFSAYDGHVQATNQLAEYLPAHKIGVTPLEYCIGGIVEEAWETLTGSGNPVYERTALIFCSVAAARAVIDDVALFLPRDVRNHVKEYGDLTWYMSAALAETGVSLQTATNTAVATMTDDCPELHTFSELDEHVRNHPSALRIPNKMKHDIPDSALNLPDFIDCEYDSSRLFGHTLAQTVRALETYSRAVSTEHMALSRQQIAEYAGKLLWCNTYILQNRFDTSIADVAMQNIQKTTARAKTGTTFGTGDTREISITSD
jgi:hypothetical protein